MKLPPNYRLVQLNSVDSTNLEARRQLQSGVAQAGKLVIAATTQTAGKGRLGRRWESEAGNLFMSLIVSGGFNNNVPVPENHQISPQELSHYPFLAATAIGATLAEFTNAKPLFKWPNDVLLDGRKISGVLIETIAGQAIIGIGINIASYPHDGVRIPATCLNHHSKRQVSVAELLELLLYNLDKNLHLPKVDIINEWMLSAYGLGKNVTVEQSGRNISGIFRGVDMNGLLILDTDGGKRELVSCGDVAWIED